MKLTKLVFMGAMALGFSLGVKSYAGGPNDKTQSMEMAHIGLEDFFRNPDRSGYQISPNGEYYSYTAPWKNRMNIFIQKIGEKEATRITSIEDRDIAGYFWANDNRLIYLRDNGGDENFYLVGVDRSGENEKKLTEIEGVRTQIIDDLEGIPNEMIIGLNKENPQVFDAYRLDIVTGEMKIIAKNPGNISGWMTDHDGKLRIAFKTDGVTTTLLHRKTEADEFTKVLSTNFKESLSPLFFTFDNKNIYASSNLGRDKSAIVLFDLEEHKEKEVLFAHDEVDVSSLSYSRKRKVLTTISFYTDKRKRKFLDEQSEMLLKDLEAKLGKKYEIGISASNDDENKFIVRTYSDKTRGAYYFYNSDSKELIKLEELSPWLEEENMCSMEPIQYKTRDGFTIHGYLTLPKGVEAKNLPVVVNPHGGPWARDYWGFNPEIQFLANRGYAVLQMNFRGSTGYGRKFWEASFGQWGLSMQDDVTDGAKWLIDQGIADPNRIAIYGGSYGGYATLQGLVKDPDFYACGIDYVGVSNLFSFMNTIPPYWKPYLEMMYEMVGNPEDAEDKLRMEQTSPALNSDKIKSPLFIAQGAKDPRVNRAESDQMVEALETQGVKVQYLVKENEGHGFHNEENKFEFYRAMEIFLEKNLAKY